MAAPASPAPYAIPLCGCRIASRHAVRVTDLAGALVDAAAGTRPCEPLLRKVLWLEWDDKLYICE